MTVHIKWKYTSIIFLNFKKVDDEHIACSKTCNLIFICHGMIWEDLCFAASKFGETLKGIKVDRTSLTSFIKKNLLKKDSPKGDVFTHFYVKEMRKPCI